MTTTPAAATSHLATNGAPYSEDADIHASSDEYAARFGGEVGTWLLSVQTKALTSLLDPEIQSILDVGGGHGQIALPLVDAHRSVTILGSSSVCATRLREQIDNGVISFQVGNLIDLPYTAASFDGVVSFRLLSHCVAWKTLIAELCRVARHAVIIDYPTWVSVNFLSPLTFQVKRRIEGNTRTFTLFSSMKIRREFKKHGFQLAGLEKQFFFPMAIHRALETPGISQTLESIARSSGMTHLFGSPIIAKFVRE
jgi:2-polyprenyl-3-methyl-5-hydroxy-6-metoxy-1,4-benzoquinol methylase